MTNKPISEEKYLVADAVVAIAERIAELEQQLAAASQKARNFEEVAHGLNSENDTLKQQLASSTSHADNFEKKMWHYHQLAETECERANSAEQQLAVELAHNVTNAVRAFVTDGDIKALNRFAECCDDPESGGHDLEKEQVTRLEKIGALQRTGRVSYITDFGDLVLSLRIPVEGE